MTRFFPAQDHIMIVVLTLQHLLNLSTSHGKFCVHLKSPVELEILDAFLMEAFPLVFPFLCLLSAPICDAVSWFELILVWEIPLRKQGGRSLAILTLLHTDPLSVERDPDVLAHAYFM